MTELVDEALFTVWLEGRWRWVTSRMSLGAKEAAWQAVKRYYDAEVDHDSPLSEGWAWWRDDAPQDCYSPNGDLILCVKCSGTKATVRFVPERESWETRRLNDRRVFGLDHEHLLWTCDSCRYQWTAPCKDAVVVGKPSSDTGASHD